MRLIDADVLSELVGEPIEVFLSRLDLKLPPTVNAIPVEWIERYDEEEWIESGIPHTAVTKLLEVWHERKEE